MEKRMRVVSSKFCWLVFLSMIVAIALVLNGPLADAKAKEKKLVDLNTASQKELEGLKGVGAATAKKIIAARPYKSVDELSKAGLSPKQIENLKPFVTVGAAPSPAPAATTKETAPKKEAATKLVDLNTASQKELEGLKGVGAPTAKKIIAARPYKSVDELSKAGLSPKQIENLKPFVTVGAAPSAAPAVKAKETAPKKEAATIKETKPAKAATTKLAPGEKVNINTASKEKLEALPDIGPVRAQGIIDGRPYKTIEEIKKVKGIGDKIFEKIKDMITI